MEVLGERNWYLPTWLGWLPKISVEGTLEEEVQPVGGRAPEFVPVGTGGD
jgi:RND superfamily putative drug exporter